MRSAYGQWKERDKSCTVQSQLSGPRLSGLAGDQKIHAQKAWPMIIMGVVTG